MQVICFPSGPFATNAYLIFSPETKAAGIIDAPPESASKLIKTAEYHQLKLEKILLTHSHWDHIADAAELCNHYSLKPHIHPEDAPNLQNPGSDRLPCWISIQSIQEFIPLKDGEKVAIGPLTFEVLHTPGHSPGGVCFYEKEQAVLFSGDTLFKGTMGNISFPTSRPELMRASLKKLEKLPPQTKVYPGHGPSTTIGEEHWLKNAESMFS